LESIRIWSLHRPNKHAPNAHTLLKGAKRSFYEESFTTQLEKEASNTKFSSLAKQNPRLIQQLRRMLTSTKFHTPKCAQNSTCTSAERRTKPHQKT
jgi:hypothetical protein